TLLALAVLAGSPETNDVGPLVRALWVVQAYGTPEALKPANDHRVKAVLAKALAKDNVITVEELGDFMQPGVFERLAGPDGELDAEEIKRAIDAATPETRAKLSPQLRAHAEYLTTTFDLLDPAHREAGERLASWITANYRPGRPLYV